MRAPDLNDGTLKAFLVLILLGANIALAAFMPGPAPTHARRGQHGSMNTPPAETYVARR